MGEKYNGEKYNGWTNRQTWLANLWLTNDEGTERAAREAALEGREALKFLLEELVLGGDPPPPTLATDLLTDALAAVNLREIADSLQGNLQGDLE
jgi:hypothetical protein